MKNLIFWTLLVGCLIYSGCSDNSEDPGVDCNQSDLSVSVQSSVLPTCETKGSIVVIGSGGTEPYTYSIDGTNFQTSTEFRDLVAGSLTITIKDADDCSSTLNTTLEADGGISVSLTTTNSECLNDTGSIEVTASGGDNSYSYSLDDGPIQSNNLFSSVSAGNHEVTVTDGSGCSSTKSVYVSSNISLSNDIMPLLQAQCTFSGCHNGDNGSDRNWLQKEDVRAKADNIKARTQNGSMPRSPGVLTQEQVAMIACWVDDGAKDN
ncbi:SprB repeat-containing protein [Ekhidna sp.]|uniref:SprB repeat-containing protein n=1 Tax=Ekhidna sp. TaxID=2608089 RepID=UPI0032EFD00E